MERIRLDVEHKPENLSSTLVIRIGNDRYLESDISWDADVSLLVNIFDGIRRQLANMDVI